MKNDREERRERAKSTLERAIIASAEEIKAHGLETLWNDDQYITSARITIEIDSEMLTTVRYEKVVIPKRVS